MLMRNINSYPNREIITFLVGDGAKGMEGKGGLIGWVRFFGPEANGAWSTDTECKNNGNVNVGNVLWSIIGSQNQQSLLQTSTDAVSGSQPSQSLLQKTPVKRALSGGKNLLK
jgi:hypothetical protein